MKSLYIFLVFTFSVMLSYSQGDVEVYTTSKNYKTGKKESGVTVTVYDGSTVYLSKNTGSNGQVDFKAPIGKTYKVVFSKPGMVTRFVLIHTQNIDVESMQGRPQAGFEVSLFEDIPNVDFTPVTSEPFAEFKSDGKSPELTFNATEASKHKKKIDDLIANGSKNEKDADAEYNNAIKLADALATQKNYKDAITKYEDALKLKPTEKYPSDQIVKLEALIQADKQKNLANQQENQEYNNLIQAGDMLRDQKKYKEALAKYEEALTKKNEQYAKDQISDMEDIILKLEKEAANEEKYKAAIASGDGFMKQKSYKAAKDQYLTAQKLKPSEAYPKQKLNELEGILNAEQAQLDKKKKYDEAIIAADELFRQENWAEARTKYQEALALESAASYPAAKIKEADLKLAEIEKEKAKKLQIEKLLTEGQTAFAANQFDPAKVKYSEVLKLDAENAVAKAKLAEIEVKLNEQKANAEKNAAYTKLVTEADALVKASKLEEAVIKYEEAIKLIPDPVVTQKITDLKKQIADNKGKAERKAQYDAIIAEGENLLKSNKLPEAKQKFEAALALDGTQQLPKDKIKEIDAKIALENQNKQKKEQFDAAIAAGDQLFAGEKYSEAKTKYQEALALDAASTIAKSKIADADAKIAANAAAKQKIDQFNTLIKAGDDLASSGKFAEAKVKYQDAGKLDASSTVPPQKIQQMDAELTNQADAAKKKEQKDKYDAAMKAAEDLYKAGKLAEAKRKFSEAAGIDASQTAPAQRIQQIDAELANIESANQKKAQIASLMKEGNDLMAKNEFENAKTKYNAVLNLDPNNSEAPLKIQEANKKLADMQNAEQKEAQFKSLKSQGFEQFTQQKYNEAKQTLLQAKELKADADVEKKLTEIETKLKEIQANAIAEQAYQTLMQEAQALETAENYYAAVVKYQEASSKKPNEQLPKTKIEALNKLIEEHKKNKAAQAEIDAKYNAEMKRGNDLMARENYLEAIQAFNAAGAIKPSEKEPVDKATRAEQMARDKNTDADKAYQKVLDAGQAAIDIKDWAKATDMYTRAVNLAEGMKKDQAIPKAKLAEIERLKQEEENAKKNQADLDKNYAAKLALGETETKAKKYDEAISAYEAASALKPNEQLPKTKIEELRELKNKEQNANQEKVLYNAAMQRGNDALNSKKYDLALSEFKNALVVIPNDKTATSKVSEVQQILDNLANSSAKQKLQEEYNQLIQEADQLFNQQKWESAEGRYEAALARINNDSYAKKQIDKCKANQKANLAVEEAYKKKIAEADASYNSSDFKTAKTLYLEAVDIKKGDSYVQQRLDEIETLLNPAVAQTGPLPNLGIPTSNSIIDGEAALIQAEQKRKSTKASKVKKKGDKIDDKNKVMDSDKTNQLLYTSNEISEVEKKRIEKTVTDDESRQATVEVVKEKDIFITDEQKKASDFKYGENLNATQYTTDVRTEVNTDFEKSILVYEDNTDAVKTYNTRLTDEMSKDSKTRYEEKIENQGQLTAISVKVDEKVIDDFESRKITESDVLQTQVKVIETVKDNEAKSTKNFNEIETSLDQTNKVVNVKFEEDSKVSNANSEDVKVVQVKTEETYKTIDEKKSSELLDSDKVLTSKKSGVIEAVSTSDNNRQEAVEQLKEGDKKLYVAENENFNTAMVKSLTNQDQIVVQKQVNSGVSELEEATKANNISGIKNVDQKVLVVSKDNEMTDEQKRLKQRNEVEGIAQTVDKTTESAKGKPSENEEGLKTVNKNVNSQGEVADKKQQDKMLEARKLVEQYGKNEIKFDEKVANALGTQYPEGVSQESFVINDEDGLLKAMVTRRIVVANGYGQIYVRTQTLTSTTYSKNGQPSSEYVWQKETGDAKLVKNY